MTTAQILRAGSQQVPCPTCAAIVGATCVNTQTGSPLHRPAHEPRLFAAADAGHVVIPEPLFPDEEFES